MIGQRLGRYRIAKKPGKGGMGVVYRARDEHVNRDVAIKVLPEDFARDRERLARFARKARLLASLNRPNIVAIYGLGRTGLGCATWCWSTCPAVLGLDARMGDPAVRRTQEVEI